MVQTFVVRVFVGEEHTEGLRGVVHHISSGQERPFGGTDDLLSFIEAGIDDAAASSGHRKG